MIPALEQTPPIVAYLLGFFMALSLRQGRLNAVMDTIFERSHQGRERSETTE